VTASDVNYSAGQEIDSNYNKQHYTIRWHNFRFCIAKIWHVQMKPVFLSFLIAGFLLTGCGTAAQAQTRAAQTSSARAAYGNPAPFKAHVKKNQRSKKKAQRSARRKRVMQRSTPYRRLPM
jgi:hypothetical protein